MGNIKNAEMERILNDHGLTVLLTRDYNAILLELALLKRADRLLRTEAASNKPLAALFQTIDHGADFIRNAVPVTEG